MTQEQKDFIVSVINQAFAKHKSKIGYYGYWEWAISEDSCEDFVMDILNKMEKPYCPRCKSVMEATRFRGYYDEFDYWSCNCDNLEVEHTRCGAYA